jgi:phytoene synthase
MIGEREVDLGGLLQAEARIRSRLLETGAALMRQGMPELEAAGQLIRPLVAYAGRRGLDDERFWHAVAAVQLAHEASLVHDDIVDRAAERRGAASVVARVGVARALLRGDHLLTSSYRAAAETGSLDFARAFARAVERTVAGEVRQAALLGRRLDAATYRQVVAGKSGELFGCALATGALIRGDADAAGLAELGTRIGRAYQLIDDLLDYLPHAATGKPPLADYRQRQWTWVLDALGEPDFGRDPLELVARMYEPEAAGGEPRIAGLIRRVESELDALESDLRRALPEDRLLPALLQRWRTTVRRSALGERPVVAAAAAPARPDLTGWPPVPSDADAWLGVLARGSRSFRFAARLFPPDERRRVAGVYAFCRYTDDLVDRADGLDASVLERRLDTWRVLAGRAYDGERTGIALLDALMAETASRGVPFRYAAELIEGVRMDLRPVEYASLAELRTYTFRVASVVGMWLTELAGVRDAAVLDRAAALGHAMQLTNVLRDVGEDLDAGRIYLPRDMRLACGIDAAALSAMRRTGRIGSGYRDLLEELMAVADAAYREAFAAVPALPAHFQKPVAVAAFVYRGIHDSIRRNGYDNLTRRAFTTRADKLRLAAVALVELRRVRRRSIGATARTAPSALPVLGGAAPSGAQRP